MIYICRCWTCFSFRYLSICRFTHDVYRSRADLVTGQAQRKGVWQEDASITYQKNMRNCSYQIGLLKNHLKTDSNRIANYENMMDHDFGTIQIMLVRRYQSPDQWLRAECLGKPQDGNVTKAHNFHGLTWGDWGPLVERRWLLYGYRTRLGVMEGTPPEDTILHFSKLGKSSKASKVLGMDQKIVVVKITIMSWTRTS